MKKYSKVDYLNLSLIITSFFAIFIFLLVHNGTSYASTIDYSYQHYLIPEYFRTLFYNTKNLLPSFAFNLGMGQNIFNFSYYGYLSPVILISYLLPFLKMKTYLEIASLVLFVISIILCYSWISDKTSDKKIRFISTFLYTMSGPLIFHTHRHIMFMCYMPFVFMGLFGVESYLKNKKPYLLIISNILLITSSYFFSVPSLIVLFIYAIYLYLGNNKKIKLKDFIKNHLVLAWYFILPVLISAVLLLPSLKAILDNRFKEATEESIFTYLIPNISFGSVLYGSYSMGLSAILIVSIIHLLLKKEKSTRFLAIVFTFILCFPIINYILNGFMYLNGKVFIPFIPLGLLLITKTLEDLLLHKEKITKPLIIIISIISVLGCIKYNQNILYIIDLLLVISALLLSKKYNNSIIIILLLISISCFNCIRININDTFNDEFIENNQYDLNIKKLINNIKDENIYRTIDSTNNAINSNNIRTINEYKTTMYSSITNKYYKDFYWNIFDTDNPNRNDAIFSDITNPLFNIYFGNKYLIGNNPPIGYSLVDTKNNVNLYENSDVFTIGYSNSNLMSEKDFDMLDYPYSVEALMNYTIVNKDITSDYKPRLKRIEIDNIFNKTVKEEYKINLKNEKDYTIKSLKDLDNKIVIIKFDMNYSQKCSEGDTFITINGIKNVLTCKSWKYHNNNYSFTYVISEPNELDIEVEKGKYDISDVTVYTIDYNDIKSINNHHDEFIIDKVKSDLIKGHINVRENGYFNLSNPYDKGYNIYVDGKKTNVEKVNKSFIGFEIEKGFHNVEINYSAPWLKLGKTVSLTGIALLIITIGYKGVKRHEKNINDSTLL